MINAKVKIFYGEYSTRLEGEMSEFLQTIDVRQIIKTDYSTAATTSSYRYTAIIYYVDLEDIRDAKIENVLEIK
jgi:hypothetical protein